MRWDEAARCLVSVTIHFINNYTIGEGGSNCVLSNGQELSKGLRVEYRMMTDDQRMRYHTAMWTIKGSGEYNVLSRIHSQFTVSAGAHSGPAFLPWHREYIKRMEFALRRIDPLVTLPYWDSTMDGRLPNPSDSVMFGNELMGKGDVNGTVTTGAFRNWLIDDVRI
uniref:Tyrosinase_Cu-bd domain-containing protein n=1 Tax=Heterorhabditis bacteriophora TaxID=37862 RepID=A0A1I7WS93_HETBA